jgi:hypothetical protein
MHTSGSWHFGELDFEVRDHRRARPSKSNYVFMDTSESWGQKPSKSKTIEEQSRFFYEHFGELGAITARIMGILL